MSKIAMVPCWSLRPSTSCFPGYAISSRTVSTTAPTCVTLSPNSASGPSRSSNAPLTLLAFNCCRAAGSSNEPWPGSIETAAWQRISKHRLRAPRRGSTSPLYSSSSGDWLDPYAMYLRYNTTIPIKIQTLRLRRLFDLGQVYLRILAGEKLLYGSIGVFDRLRNDCFRRLTARECQSGHDDRQHSIAASLRYGLDHPNDTTTGFQEEAN